MYVFDRAQEVSGVHGAGITGWQSLDWGCRAGVMGRESCLWTVLQRELKGMCLLQEAALTRLDSLGFQWNQQVQIHFLSP